MGPVAGSGADGAGDGQSAGHGGRVYAAAPRRSEAAETPCDPRRVMPEPFAEMLQGRPRNSLGRAEEVVNIVLADRPRLDELFASLADSDELVCLRAGDASRRSAGLGQRGSGHMSSACWARSGASSSRRFNGTWPRSCSTCAVTSRTSRRSEPQSCSSATSPTRAIGSSST